MKYLCSDGIDRDSAIDRYLALDKSTTALDEKIKELTFDLSKNRNEVARIFRDELGLIGHSAAMDELARRQNNAR